jgi:uncharacterized protein (DUF433 family)
MARRKVLDIGDAPLYGIPEAALYLDIPVATLRSWVSGRTYPTSRGLKFFHPLIDLADPLDGLASFYNLVEAHILVTFRRHYNIPIPNIRDAMDYLRGSIDHPHPLITQEFYLHGKDLVIEEMRAGELTTRVPVNATKKGQLGIREVLGIYLERIDRRGGLPASLHPMKRSRPLQQPEIVEINPNVAFGAPVLKGTSMTIAMIIERHEFGMSPKEIAEDFDLQLSEVKQAISYYGQKAA